MNPQSGSPSLSFGLLTGQPLWLQALVGLLVLTAAAFLAHLVTRRLVLGALRRVAAHTAVGWDEVLFESRVVSRLARLVPVILFKIGIDVVPGLTAPVAGLLHRLASATLIVLVARVVDAMLTAAHEFYARSPKNATRPIKSYVQLATLFVYLVAGVFVVARLADQSPWFFVSGLGAMMAIVLLIFRDTLLSLVASIQITNNDLVRVGDWIEMPQFDADGDVIDIALNTVSVRNWDRTITVIPTHKFLDHSFRNWRGMFEGGGRRIKRAIHVNTSSIRFLTDDEVERFGRFALLKDYVAAKLEELREHNRPWTDDPETIVNARRLTNVGTLRAYIVAYLRSHPAIRQDFTFLVRQLAPTPEGLPLEIYVFTNDTRWSHYEAIQADVFDHVLAMVPEFGLSVYQRPSGLDFAPARGLSRAEAV